MTPEHYARVVELFEEALEYQREFQGAFLASACDGDNELLREVEAMLAADQQSAGCLDKPPDDIAASVFSTEASHSLIGERLGDYQVIALLGSGGMGEVFLAEDRRLARKAALKVLPQEYFANPIQLRRFEQEACSVSALNHPNIVTVYGVGQERQIFFLATEFIEGRTLREEIANGPLAPAAVVDIAIQAASALKAAHQAGIVHRDVKPENILLRPDGLIKMLDFGLAKRIEQSSGGPMVMESLGSNSPLDVIAGTPRYMSPEQARGLPVDSQTDLFSLGCVLYELLTGCPAMPGATPSDVLAAVLTKNPMSLEILRPECPPALVRVINRALEKDRGQRYQTAQELLADLRRIRLSIDRATELSPRLSGTRTILFAALAALILIAIAVIPSPLRDRLRGTSRSLPIRALAVLPLQDLSGVKGQEYFADGMTDELITEIAHIGSLRVISHTSAMRYRGVHTPLAQIARELNVDAVLRGTVLRSGERVRIAVELVWVNPEKHLWAETYTRDLRDVLALQEEVVRDITTEIRIKLTRQEQASLSTARPMDPEAHEAYLRGVYFWNKRTEPELEKSIAYFNQAVQKDPSYALACAGLANAYSSLAIYGHQAPRTIYSKALASARRALALDPALAEAHAALGFYKSNFEWDQPGAEREFRRAVELSPGYALAHVWRGETLTLMHQHSEALAELDRASGLDPTSLMVSDQRGWVLYMARRYDDAIRQLHKTIELESRFAHTHCWLGKAFLQKGMLREGLAELEHAASLPGGNSLLFTPWIGYAYALSGRRREASEIVGMMKAKERKGLASPYAIAVIYCGLGQKDQALAWLEKAYQARDSLFSDVHIEPALDFLRSDAHFQHLLRRSNLPQ